MAQFKVVTQSRPDFGSYEFEMESLAPIGAEIIAVSTTSEGEFIEAAKDADAIIAGGRRITGDIIDSLQDCKLIGRPCLP